jgi:hypothetical protein
MGAFFLNKRSFFKNGFGYLQYTLFFKFYHSLFYGLLGYCEGMCAID